MVADTANVVTALDDDIHRLRHIEFYASAEGVNLYLFILSNGSIAQVHPYATTESVKTGTVEWLATIDVFIAAIVHATTDTLAVFTNR